MQTEASKNQCIYSIYNTLLQKQIIAKKKKANILFVNDMDVLNQTTICITKLLLFFFLFQYVDILVQLRSREKNCLLYPVFETSFLCHRD